MRILVTTVTMEPVGGIEVSTLQVARMLAARGHELTLLFREDGSLGADWRAIAETVRVGDYGWSKRHPVSHSRRLWPTVAAAARARPDVIWLTRPEHLVWGVAASYAARVPLVVHLHHLPDYPGLRVIGRRAARFIAVSRFIQTQWAQAGLREDRIEIVHNGVDPTDYPFGGASEMHAARAKLNLPADAFVAVAYGRVDPGKGTDVLLEAWRRLALPADEACLVLTTQPPGSDSNDAYLAGLRANSPDGCRWLGMMRDVVPLLHASDVAVMPSRVQEAFGRVIIEAMATGRPAIASRVGGVPEVLTGRWAELLVAPGDPEVLASKLEHLRQWRAHDPDLAQRAVAHVAENFALADCARRIEQVLRTAAVSIGPASHR